MTFRIELTPMAQEQLGFISDRRVREKVAEKIDGLAHDPEKQGKPLVGELTGFRCVRAAAQRYRIIYRADRGSVLVLIMAIGLRRDGDRSDIYALAQKMIRLGLVRQRGG